MTVTKQTAFAYSQKKGDDNSKNGNTVTIEECKNRGSASRFDTATNQECENLICTHPGENATCVQEGAAAAQTPTPIPTPVNLTCKQCLAVISTVSIALGQVLSNVPFVALYNHVTINNGFTGSAHVNQWMMLAAASTISGNLTILAAAGNIIIIEVAERRGVKAFTFV